MLPRMVLLWVMLGFLAIATPIASDQLVNYTEPAIQLAQWPPPPPQCGLYNICKSPAS